MEKIGEISSKTETLATKQDNLLESLLLEHYIELTGHHTYKPLRRFIHLKYPFMRGHLDGKVAGQSKGLEIKTSYSYENWGNEGGDEIPELLHFASSTLHSFDGA